MPPEFHFLRPLWLLMLLPLGWLVWFLARPGGAVSAWRGIVDAHLLPHLLVDETGRVRRTPLILLALGWLLGVVALAGPVWERLPKPVYQAQAQRVIVLDISPSMNATDVPPSRLAHARFEVLDLLKRAREGQTALLAYGAEPFVVSPLTSDTDTIAAQVPSLDTALLPVEGSRRTDLALGKAGELLSQAGSHDGEVILVTDGLDEPAAADEAARNLRAKGYRVSVLGVGTDKGAPVPLGDGGFLKDASGAILMPALQRGALETLAAAGGGRFVPSTLDDRDVDTLIPPVRLRLSEQAQRQDTQADDWREEGPWLLLVLLPVAALAFRRGWLSPLVLIVLLAPPPSAQALDWQGLWLTPDQQAARALAEGKTKEAAQQFQRRDWQAAAHYQAGSYAKALESLQGTKGAQEAYNRGNALAHLGKLEQAIGAYDQALAQDPQDADAKFNRDLVKKLLEQKKQQQQQAQGQSDQNQGQSGKQADAQSGQGKQVREKQGQQQAAQQAGKQGQSQGGQRGEQGQQQGQQAGQQGQQKHAGGKQNSAGQRAEEDRQGGEPQGRQPKEQGQQGTGREGKQKTEQPPQTPDEGRRGVQQAESKQGAGAKEQKATQEGQESSQAAAGKEDKDAGAQVPQENGNHEEPGENKRQDRAGGAEPGLADLLGGAQRQGQAQQTAQAPQDPAEREAAQAMEQMLRRVPDDPSGLLRQRFLLQHLRRNGEFP